MLRLRIRSPGGREGVGSAVEAVSYRLPDGWPGPQFRGGILSVPKNPEAVELLVEELTARGLKILAYRVLDPIRWRS